MKTSRLLLMALLVFAFQTLTAQSQINLEIGDRYESRTEMEFAGVMVYMEREMDYKRAQDTRMEGIVKGMEDGLYELEFTTFSLQLTVKQLGQEFKYDSTNEEDFNNPQWAEIKEVFKTPKVVKIDSKGVIRDTDGSYDLEFFGDRTSLFLLIPEGLSVGESWVDKTDTDTQKNEIIYTIREISETKVFLDTRSNIDLTQSTGSAGAEVVTRSVGGFTGTVEVDKSTSMIMEYNVVLDVDITVDEKGKKTTTPTTTRLKVTNRKL